jgi:hypothetical protein
LDSIHPWHPHIEQQNIGFVRENQGYRGLTILRLGHDRQTIEEPQQGADPASHERLIVDKADPDHE